MLFTLIACGGLFACKKSEDPYYFLNPKLPLTQPFSIEKAGNKASMDFWVLPNAENATRFCDVMFLFNYADKAGDPRKAVDEIEVPLKIKVFYVQNGDRKPIEARVWSKSIAAASLNANIEQRQRLSISEGDAYLVDDGWDSSQVYMSVASFKPEKFGQYHIEIETIKDQPVFNNHKSEIVISQDFSHGE